ncbi:hypothetical protein PENANT_c048G00679 [Penicillium antarcticum]|uniref:Cyclin-like domain-containing protein n=2 Tax=Penicillium antarcticum TaxID=416450 RepID=A0A1V6PRD5_9EURO|nr:hypothetical protein PENANT_c048G00679 [Penicillium antarcticum]
MAAVTQTECMPDDTDADTDTRENTNVNVDVNATVRPALAMLNLDSPDGVIGDADHADSPRNHAAAVFGISPEAAVHLLCFNVEALGARYIDKPSGTDGLNSHSSTPLECETPVGEGQLGVQSIGLHVNDPNDLPNPARATEEAVQLAILAKKFLSKKVPAFPLKEYLLRLHKYCPMSTAVYLAASVYISKMTLDENVLRVMPRNVHRLVLAGIWVASKALEDLKYSHSRVAKVGGVSEQELSKLEISFCFLANFELRVDAQMLLNETLRFKSPE